MDETGPSIDPSQEAPSANADDAAAKGTVVNLVELDRLTGYGSVHERGVNSGAVLAGIGVAIRAGG